MKRFAALAIYQILTVGLVSAQAPRKAPFALRDLVKDPPVVESSSLELVEAVAEIDPKQPRRQAALAVKFVAREGLPSLVPIQLDATRVLLRDDGVAPDAQAADGTYTAWIDVNLIQLRELQARQQVAAQRSVFQGRELRKQPVSTSPFPLSDLMAKKPISLVAPLPTPAPVSIDPKRSLMITDLGVVEDPDRTFNPCTGAGTPMGKWTFGYLMQQMANQSATGIDPSVFVRRWLKRWLFDQTVNDWNVPARPRAVEIIQEWETRSGGPGSPLDLSKAPFRLLAIVNRIDLRDNVVYGGGSAGEGRFVFCLVDDNCNPQLFTVIFEYGIEVQNCGELKAWGQEWANLSTMAPGTPAYNGALERITERFARVNAMPSRPNGSALNQLRTNEIRVGAPWELREFQIFSSDSDAGHLRQVSVKKTPDLSTDVTSRLADYVNTEEADILLEKHDVPLDFPVMGDHFLGGAAPTNLGMFWSAPGIRNPEARYMFSVNTCNGCHAGETGTPFTHISPASFGTEAALSNFLTGGTVVDPAGAKNPDGTPLTRAWNDLQRRQQDLSDLLGAPCFKELLRQPLRATH